MPDKSTWSLIAAAAVAVVTVTAAGFVMVDHHTSPTTKKITGTTADTPGLAWSLDAAEYLGRPFADFSDPRDGSSYNSGTPGFVLAGDTLVTLAGVPTEGYELDDAVMIGVDAEDGTVRWQAPAADLQQCSGEPLDGKLYCFTMGEGYELVTYDIESGESARRPIEESVFGLTTTEDTLYVVEGNAEDNEVRVHSGTYDDVSANWTQSFDIGGVWEEVFGRDILTVTDGVGLVKTGIEMAQFNAQSGAELWKTDDYCLYAASLESGGVVMQANTDCEAYNTVTEQLLRGPDGKVLATARSRVAQNPVLEDPSDTDGPIILGDAAYDRATGERLWANADLATDEQGSQYGAVTAVVGDVVYLRDPAKTTASGIDLRTGRQLWQRNSEESFTPTAADGSVIVGEDRVALTALDVSTGRVVWMAPFAAIDADPETFASGGAVEAYGDGWIFSSDRRIIGLEPL